MRQHLRNTILKLEIGLIFEMLVPVHKLEQLYQIFIDYEFGTGIESACNHAIRLYIMQTDQLLVWQIALPIILRPSSKENPDGILSSDALMLLYNRLVEFNKRVERVLSVILYLDPELFYLSEETAFPPIPKEKDPLFPGVRKLLKKERTWYCWMTDFCDQLLVNRDYDADDKISSLRPFPVISPSLLPRINDMLITKKQYDELGEKEARNLEKRMSVLTPADWDSIYTFVASLEKVSLENVLTSAMALTLSARSEQVPVCGQFLWGRSSTQWMVYKSIES